MEAPVEAHFAEAQKYPGWVELQWCKPTGAVLQGVEERLKALKLTLQRTA